MKKPLRILIFGSLLTALSILFGKFLAFNIGEGIRISFENLPVIFASVALGPLWGCAVGVAADLLGSVLRGYSINPLIPFVQALMGFLPGFLIRTVFRRLRPAPIVLSVTISHVLLSMGLKTAILYWFYYPGTPYWILQSQRVITYLIVCAAEAYLAVLLLRNSSIRREFDLPNDRFERRKAMTYEEALTYIHSVSWRGRRPGLSRITELCRLLGDPQKKLKFVHVAGTNGKGSVSAMTASVLRAAGYRTGLYTSPYLVDFTERMGIDGVPIPHDELCRITAAVKKEADRMADGPTEFELITAIAFLYYLENKCDVVVLECGLGGRLDATNVIDESVLSVITNIALDHTEILGDTAEKIAAEKGGILKGAPCVLGSAPDGAQKVIETLCREKGLSFLRADRSIELEDVSHTREGMGFTYGGERLFVPLCGMYQETNVKTVLAAIEELRKAGYAISKDALKEGLAKVEWHGRFETLAEDPRVIFDGAHNPDGVTAAAATCEALYAGERIVLVTGVMKDKSYDAMANTLAGVAETAYTGAPQTPRALPAEEWATALSAAGMNATACPSMKDAVFAAAKDAKENGGVVLCAGSLYSYAEIRDATRELPEA